MATSLTISVLADVAKAVQGIDQIDQRTQSWGQKMQGIAGVIGGAFSTQKIAGIVEGWVNAGLDANRALKNVSVTFGAAGAGVAKWADDNASSFGQTAAEAEKMAAKVGVALEGYGLSNQDAAKQSEALVSRSADIAKVLGVDQSEVLAKLETAMRGRTAGLKDYGVQVEKGASQTDIFNAFMKDTEKYAGQADTGLGNIHGTFGDLTAILGQALVPVLKDLIPLIQWVGDWAKNNKVAFEAIVFTITALALAMGIAATVAGILAIAEWAVLWPVLLIVAGIAALIAVIVIVIVNWGTLVGWFHEGVTWLGNMVDKVGEFIGKFTGPAWAGVQKALEWLKGIWADIHGAIDNVLGIVGKLWDKLVSIGEKLGGILSKIPGVGALSAPAPSGAPGPSAYGAAPAAQSVTFAPQITITGDIGDPVLAGRRIVDALEAWTAANGRRRIAALAGGP